MARPHGRSAQREAGRWRTTLLAAALVVVAVVPGWAAAAAPVIRTAESVPHSPPGEPTGDPEEPTSPPATAQPPGETSAPPSPSTPAPTATTGVPAPSSGPPPRATTPPQPTYAPPSPRPTPTPAPSTSGGVRVGTGGITLGTDGVAIDADGASAGLTVRLGNRSAVDAQGRVEVVLPTGVTVPAAPSGCAAVEPTRTRCDLGSVPAGRTGELRLPVAATPQARRAAPLAGAVIGQLDPREGPSRRVRLSFRITVATPEEPATASPAGPVAAPAGAATRAADRSGGASLPARSVVSLIGLSALLVLLALGLATLSLRRRTAVPEVMTSAEALRSGTGAPDGTGSVPQTGTGIWFRPQRPARRAGGDLDYGGLGETPQEQA
ncbi:hypothetical protein Vqi01_53880 [Micromonospora qiuiae]|uniref:Uncharacterized protein n=1 Tax=Micromonospora qiuiae TaxID=502268 RepID=A0ABQ4JHY1_9ACTN|nr:hypothetical protein [Micromonospora qiuiae]GIJ30226.1 hypothetical protein Vqi01_53880 [Micromonospora qiuiae]